LPSVVSAAFYHQIKFIVIRVIYDP
jgi:hypothetical protein